MLLKNYLVPKACLFSETYSDSDIIAETGITREQWKKKYEVKFSNNQIYQPDPILILAVARDFWRKYPDAVVVRLPNGEKRVIGWEHLMKLRELEKLLASGKITKEEYG